MKPELTLSISAARALMLRAQGLDCLKAKEPPNRQATKADVLSAIESMALLQLDTIHVVARSQYFVLWSRLGDYKPAWLDELLAEARVFEQWVHAACIVPTRDFGLIRSLILQPSPTRGRKIEGWYQGRRADAEAILAHIRANGPVRSADFERQDGRIGGTWWDWKPEKEALEVLWLKGELMVARRENFHRVYDLRERVIPDWDDARLQSRESAHLEMVENTVRALGVAASHWIADYYRLYVAETAGAVKRLVQAGTLIPVAIEGLTKNAFVHADNLELARSAARGRLKPTRTTLLSPFDPLVWDRQRGRELFDFDYTIECYTPAAKRIYGYLTYPILHRGALVGRVDPKAHRREKRFEVKRLHLEPQVEVTDALLEGIATALRDGAAWHSTPQVEVAWASRDGLAAALMAQLGAMEAVSV